MLATEHVEFEDVSEMSDSHLKIVVTDLAPKLLHRNQNRCIFVFEQEHQELGWHRLARVATNGVNIVGAFVERLSGREGYGLPAVHAHDDAAFQHIDEGLRVVAVDRVRATRRIFDRYHQKFFTRNIWQRF